MAKDNNINKKLLDFYNIGYKKGKKTKTVDKIFPTKEVEKETKKGKDKVRVREVFPPEVDKYYKQWLSSTHDDSASWNDRVRLWEDCQLLGFNCQLVTKAINLIADETIQADSNEQPITVEAKGKIKKDIEDFFDKVNIYSFLGSTTRDIVKYGNAGWILSFDTNGVDKIIQSEIFDLKDRMEFSPAKIREMKSKNNKFLRAYTSKVNRIDQLIDMIENKDNISSYYDKYLFGFQIGDYVLPPWRYIHFRNFTIESPFEPYGVPFFIHSISAYRQYDAAMTMQQAARGAQLPIDLYKLSFPNVMNETEKLNRVIEFIAEWQNSGINNINKEEIGVGESIVTIDDLLEYTQISSNIDLGKLDDIELLRDDIIQSTMLPRYMIDQNDGGFGESGTGLIEKWKPFARLVYKVQSILLQNISQVVKIHLLHSGKYALEDINFILKMPYPESQTNTDIIDSQNSLRDLATSTIDDFADKFFDGSIDEMPNEVIKDIYCHFLPYDNRTIDSWMNDMIKNKEENREVGDKLEEKALKIKMKRRMKKLQENYGSRKNLREAFNEIIFENKQRKIKEGVILNKHMYSSKNKCTDFSAEWLRILDAKEMESNSKNKLNEKELKKAEEMKYKFKYDNEKKKSKKNV